MIDIIVPVLGRPANAPKVAASIKAATKTPYRLIFICSPGDEEQIAASRKVGEVVVVDWEPGVGDCARKLNYGFSICEGKWFFQAADDVHFHDAWAEEALAVHEATGALVIGTNDLHNPAVQRGILSTHTLISREYIERYGSGTWDGQGTVFCEEYDHQFIDNELVEVARGRREFAFAAASIVEHQHPYWKKAEMDGTYEKAFRDTRRDQRLFVWRKRKFGRRR